MKEYLFEMPEIREDAQAVNEEVTANATTSENNVPACEGEVENLHVAGDVPADVEQDLDSNRIDQAQQPLM